MCDDFDGLVFEVVCVDEGFGGDDAAGCSVLCGVHVRRMLVERTGEEGKVEGTDGCRAAHEFGEFVGDLGRIQDLFHAPSVAELGVWVLDGVFVVFGSWYTVMRRK